MGIVVTFSSGCIARSIKIPWLKKTSRLRLKYLYVARRTRTRTRIGLGVHGTRPRAISKKNVLFSSTDIAKS